MTPLQDVLERLPRIREAAQEIRDELLANIVMTGEIPAATGQERHRVEFWLHRLAEAGLAQTTVDELNNGAAVLVGTEGVRNILLVAAADTGPLSEKEQFIEVEAGRLVGPFVVDNCIALGALATLPSLLEKLQISLKSNVVFLAAARCVGRGNLQGLRAFLAQCAYPVSVGLCVEGVQLGRMNYACLGIARGEITCSLPKDYDWAQYGTPGTIAPMSEVIAGIQQIALPRRPQTQIVFGFVRGGIYHQNIARQTTLGLEARADSVEVLGQMRKQIEAVAQDVSARWGMPVTTDFFAIREPGGLDAGHPLVECGRAILTQLGLTPQTYLTTSPMSALVEWHIPALTVGITTGARLGELEEFDEACAIPPMATGLAQLVGLLLAIDGGCLDGTAGVAGS